MMILSMLDFSFFLYIFSYNNNDFHYLKYREIFWMNENDSLTNTNLNTGYDWMNFKSRIIISGYCRLLLPFPFIQAIILKYYCITLFD